MRLAQNLTRAVNDRVCRNNERVGEVVPAAYQVVVDNAKVVAVADATVALTYVITVG